MVAAFMLWGLTARADTTPYPAPSVPSGGVMTSIQVLPTSAASGGSGLAYTGVGSSLWVMAVVAGAVLLAGVLLTVLGARRVWGHRSH
jgi:hypothetical protein